MRFLVLTLYSGEREISKCLSSVYDQRFVEVEQRCFKYMPNVEAHRALYSEIMYEAGRYDFFVKLDADMVLASTTDLRSIGEYMKKRPSLDHIVIPVYDHFTDHWIAGMHVFSPRVAWNSSDDELFVDPLPEISGERVLWAEVPSVRIDHAPEHDERQAFFFGFQRARKAIQDDRTDADIVRGYRQLRNVLRLRKRASVSRDRRAIIGLLAAKSVLSGDFVCVEVEKAGTSVEAYYNQLSQRSDSELVDSLGLTMLSGIPVILGWLWVLGPVVVLRKTLTMFIERYVQKSKYPC